MQKVKMSKYKDQLSRNILSLNLPETNEFWSAPPQPCTSVKVWDGQNVLPDHAVDLK
jgi:hypothetical protein